MIIGKLNGFLSPDWLTDCSAHSLTKNEQELVGEIPMTESDPFKSVRENRELIEDIAEVDHPISKHAQRILDNLDEQEE